MERRTNVARSVYDSIDSARRRISDRDAIEMKKKNDARMRFCLPPLFVTLPIVQIAPGHKRELLFPQILT